MSTAVTAGTRPRFGRSPTALWAQFRTQFGVSLATQIAYRGGTAIWVFASAVTPLVSIVVWRTVAGPGGSIAGYDARTFATYFIITMVVDHLTFVWLMWEVEWRIRSGYYSPLLVRPMHPIVIDVCTNLTYKLVGLVGIVPSAIVLAIVFRADFSTVTVGSVVTALPALVLAMVMRFAFEWTVALAAFWTTRIGAVNAMYFMVSGLLSGIFAPLAVMPGWAQTLARWTPFPWSVSWVTQVSMGQVRGADLIKGYGIQLAWIVVVTVIAAFTWRRALKTYSAVGT